MKKITVNASKTYDVIIGKGILDEAGTFLRNTAGGQSVAIVTDDNVAKLYGKKLAENLSKNAYRVAQYVFPAGESSKNGQNFLSLLNFLAEEKFSRSDTVIALGGGVTGDLAGFAAASYMRGIRFVQIPTTLLAAVDSSVGGKTAIDLPAGKNLAGAFYQPNLVLCDVSTLSSLPPEVYRDGCAEIIKYAMICDSALFESLKTPIDTQYEKIIAHCVEIKSEIVMADEFEKGRRKLLNFGHTIGHAIEKLSAYSISHGSAVAAGMAIITNASFCMGLCNENCYEELIKMLRLYNLPSSTSYKANEIFNACLSDKKRSGENITIVLPVDIGNCILKEIPVNELEKIIGQGI